jgi:hypothetical protein
MPIAAGIGMADPALAQGGGVAGAGLSVAKESDTMLQAAAQSQSEREMYNARVRSQNKQGSQELGSAAGGIAGAQIGASYGTYGGPIGMAVGAIAGGLIGGLFSR